VNLWTAAPDGSNLHQITALAEPTGGFPHGAIWAPGGKALWYWSGRLGPGGEAGQRGLRRRYRVSFPASGGRPGCREPRRPHHRSALRPGVVAAPTPGEARRGRVAWRELQHMLRFASASAA
jgi:hypothetical protein